MADCARKIGPYPLCNLQDTVFQEETIVDQNFNNQPYDQNPNQQPQQPQQPIQQPQPAPQPGVGFNPELPQKPKTPGLAIASLVLGICGIVFGCCIAIVVLILSVVGLVLGVVANKQVKTGIGTAGLIVSCVGVGLMIVNMILGAVLSVSGILANLF